MDHNQQYQVFSFYQNSPQTNQPRPVSQPYFHSSEQPARSIQPSPVPSVYPPFAMEPTPSHSLMPRMPGAHSHPQANGEFGTQTSELVNEALHRYYPSNLTSRQTPDALRMQAHEQQLYHAAQSIHQYQQQQNTSGCFSRDATKPSEINSTKPRINGPIRIAQRPIVSSGSLVNNKNSLVVDTIWAQENLRTPESLINDLAKRFNIGVIFENQLNRYREHGDEAEMFSVRLKFGDELFYGIGNSYERARHNAAQEALRESKVISSNFPPRLFERKQKHNKGLTSIVPAKPSIPPHQIIPDNRLASMTPTVELNALAMKFRLKVLYSDHQHKRPGIADGRPAVLNIFVATCDVVGSIQTTGEAQSRKEARQKAAKAALDILNKKTPDQLLAIGIGTPPNLQSEISQIYDFAARRGLAVVFKVDIATPLPDQTFISVCTLGSIEAGGELQTIGRGKSKKEAKLKACIEMLQKIRSFTDPAPQPVPDVIRAGVGLAKPSWRSPKAMNTPKIIAQPLKPNPPDPNNPDYLLDINPVSRIFQIFQAKKNGILPSFATVEELCDEEDEVNNKKDGRNLYLEIANPVIDQNTKISVKTTENGKYVIQLDTPPIPGSAVSMSQTVPVSIRKPRIKRSQKLKVSCTCGEKVVYGEDRSIKVAKVAAANEMLKLLGYNLPPVPPSPPPLLDSVKDGDFSTNNETLKKNKKATKTLLKNDIGTINEINAMGCGGIQLFFHPALFAPPKSNSLHPSSILTANDLLGSAGTLVPNGIGVTDLTIISKRFKSLEKGFSVQDMINIAEEIGGSKLSNVSFDDFLSNESAFLERPHFHQLKMLCLLAGCEPKINHKVNNSSHLVFVDLANAMFCGEGSSENEALENVALTLVDSIASTVIQDVTLSASSLYNSESEAKKD